MKTLSKEASAALSALKPTDPTAADEARVRKNLERAESLFKQGLLPRDQLEQRQLDFRAAQRTASVRKRQDVGPNSPRPNLCTRGVNRFL